MSVRQVVYGENITFLETFYTQTATPSITDPTTVTFSITEKVDSVLYGPYTYANDQIERTSLGNYKRTQTIDSYVVPGFYTAVWVASIGGSDVYSYETFEVIEPEVTQDGLLSPPRLYGKIRLSPNYADMGLGLTDTIFLLGHADGLTVNDPYQVVNMQEAVNVLGANPESPLMRGLLEAYYAGCRDIYLVAAAPMYEYVAYDPFDHSGRLTALDALGGQTFYEKYYDRLTATYAVLQDYEMAEMIVPLEAPFYDPGDVDFATQLANHCYDTYSITGSPCIGFLGTRKPSFTSADVTTLVNDSRLATFDDSGALITDEDTGELVLKGEGKFLFVAVGEAVIKLPYFEYSHVSSLAALAAGVLSRSRMDYGLTYKILPGTMSLSGPELTKEEIKSLAEARLNPAIRTKVSKRQGGAGRQRNSLTDATLQFSVRLATDNTLSPEGSDYWSIVQMRLVAKVLRRIKTIGNRHLGVVSYGTFKSDIRNYLESLVRDGLIRTYNHSVYRDDVDLTKVYVDVSLAPYFGLREIFFTVEVGPGVRS